MLRPQNNGIRECVSLDGLWDFAPDRQGTGRAGEWWRAPLRSSRRVAVPASFNDLFADPELRDHVGDVWYQRRAWVPAGWVGRRRWIRLDAATHRAVVWVNGVQVADHDGGYTPFDADITDLAEPGAEIEITVVVDNVLTFDTIPPGTLDERGDGSRRQRYAHDFFNYSGLHRSVWLWSTPLEHLRDLTVTTDVDGTDGLVHYAVQHSGDPADRPAIAVTLVDAAGVVVATGAGATGTLRVDGAELWRPGRGSLYDLVVEALDDAGGVVDRYRQPVGIRTVRVDGTRFLINGEPFQFRGFGMHEDHLVRGKGHDNASMIHDFNLLEWTGANSLRTSHYPYAEEVLDEADRRGIVVIDETAAVGLNLSVSGGLFGGPSRRTFGPDAVNDRTQEAHRRAIVELIARDKNHPCVVMWSIANEPESHTDESLAYFEPLFATARAADPTRPVSFVNVMTSPFDRCQVAALADVIMINRYYGWYIDPGDLVRAEAALERELQGWSERHGKPIIVTEYGADTVAGLHDQLGRPWSEEFQVELLRTYHRVFDRIPAVVGEHVWNFADFDTASSFFRVGGNKKGVFTRDRQPKAAAHMLRQRWAGGAGPGTVGAS